MCSLPFCHSSPRWPLNVQCTHTMFQTPLIMSCVLVPPFCLFFSAAKWQNLFHLSYSHIRVLGRGGMGWGGGNNISWAVFSPVQPHLWAPILFPFTEDIWWRYTRRTTKTLQESLSHQSPWWMFLVIAACRWKDRLTRCIEWSNRRGQGRLGFICLFFLTISCNYFSAPLVNTLCYRRRI